MIVQQPFSEREKEVIACLMQGSSNKQIAHALGIATRTVEFHLSNIYTKLGVSSRAEAILKLSEDHLRESTETSTSGGLRESTVEKTGAPQDNAIKAFLSRRKHMKTFFYLLAAVVILSILLVVWNLIQPGNIPASAIQIQQASETPPDEELALEPTVAPTLTARQQNIAEAQKLAAEYDLAVQEELQNGSYETRTDPQTGEEVILFQGASRERIQLLYDEFNERMQDLLQQYKALYLAEVQPTPFPTRSSLEENQAYFQELVDQYPNYFEQLLKNGTTVKVYDPDDGRYYERVIGEPYAQSEIMVDAMEALQNAPLLADIDQEVQKATIREAVGDPDLQLAFKSLQPLANAPWRRAAVYEDADGSYGYWVETETNQLAMIEPHIRLDISAFESKSVDDLRSAAEQFASKNSSRFIEMKDTAYYEEGYKGDIYFFRWDTRNQDWNGTDWAMMPPFLQVGILANGQVHTYINTLDLY